ncbi:uncharacterized protein [Dendrobates tinctorius]|uniref:uncharacterized protein n=1 Tax=Dendrobates tinctorius TaxID=92724 RepID=UPI003CCA431B
MDCSSVDYKCLWITNTCGLQITGLWIIIWRLCSGSLLVIGGSGVVRKPDNGRRRGATAGPRERPLKTSPGSLPAGFPSLEASPAGRRGEERRLREEPWDDVSEAAALGKVRVPPALPAAPHAAPTTRLHRAASCAPGGSAAEDSVASAGLIDAPAPVPEPPCPAAPCPVSPVRNCHVPEPPRPVAPRPVSPVRSQPAADAAAFPLSAAAPSMKPAATPALSATPVAACSAAAPGSIAAPATAYPAAPAAASASLMVPAVACSPMPGAASAALHTAAAACPSRSTAAPARSGLRLRPGHRALPPLQSRLLITLAGPSFAAPLLRGQRPRSLTCGWSCRSWGPDGAKPPRRQK